MKITLKQLANEVGYSPWHTAKIFKEITGKAPFEYIRGIRLSQAALTLRDNHKIIDVALDFVFDSHEGFTRAFFKEIRHFSKNTVEKLRRFSFSCLEKFSTFILDLKEETTWRNRKKRRRCLSR